MNKSETPHIPLKQPQVNQENCAHEWIKFQTSDGNVFKCKHCGKIITD